MHRRAMRVTSIFSPPNDAWKQWKLNWQLRHQRNQGQLQQEYFKARNKKTNKH